METSGQASSPEALGSRSRTPTRAQNGKLLLINDPAVEGPEDPLAGRRFEPYKPRAEPVALSTQHVNPGG